MHKTAITILFAAAALTFSAIASAQTTTCTPIYGGGQTCVEAGNIQLDKKIRHPETNQFVDHLTTDSPRFTHDQQVTFTIRVQNTGNNTLSGITVEDTLPGALVYTDKNGEFNADRNTVTYTIDRLDKGQARTITVQTRVVGQEALAGSDITCLANLVRAFTDDTRNNPSTDTTKFCIEAQQVSEQPSAPQQPGVPPTTKGGLPIAPQPQSATSPRTGPEMLALIGLLPAGLGGLLLRRKTK